MYLDVLKSGIPTTEQIKDKTSPQTDSVTLECFLNKCADLRNCIRKTCIQNNFYLLFLTMKRKSCLVLVACFAAISSGIQRAETSFNSFKFN